MTRRPDRPGEPDLELDGFLGDVAGTVANDLDANAPQPDFEAMLARAQALSPEASAEPDPELDAFVGAVANHVEADDGGVMPDFLAVVTRAHTLDATVVPQSAVDEVGTYAPIIALRDVARQRRGQTDPELDAFVGDVRGHLDHDLARGEQAGDTATTAEADASRRGVFPLAIAAGLLIAVGLGAALATWLDLGGGALWNTGEGSRSEAMLSPRPAPEQESEFHGHATPRPEPPTPPDAAPKTDAVPEPAPLDEVATPTRERSHKATPKARPKSKRPSRRQRLEALEREANAAWQAGKLDAAEVAFRAIIRLDPRGHWGESAYGELFTLQRQRKRSSVSLWKTYLVRFPSGRFADDARAGLCRRATGDAKAQCWQDYLDTMPRGSFRRQAQRELDAAAQQELP